MVALVARQSVILKCNMQASVMIGNYEFYYGAGLFCKLQGITAEEDILPNDLKELILAKLEAFCGEDKREQYLVKLLLDYVPSKNYDEQMKELFMWGLKEEMPWRAN